MPRRGQIQQKRRRLEEEEDSGKLTSSVEDESEGSLADFIEHDSAELDVAQDDESYEATENEDGSSAGDAEEEEEETMATEEDPDDAIRAQYTADMEMAGSVITENGVRRSMRVNKGQAPTRYVDDDYAELMLEDLTPAERAQLERELSSSDQWEEDDASEGGISDATDESSST